MCAYCFKFGREPWSGGYGRRLMFERLWVQIPAQHTRWTWHSFTLICSKKIIVCLKRPKINEKEAGVGPFLKNCFKFWKLARWIVTDCCQFNIFAKTNCCSLPQKYSNYCALIGWNSSCDMQHPILVLYYYFYFYL